MTFPHNTLYSVTPSADGTVDTRFKDGSKPGGSGSLITLDLTIYAGLMAGFANMVSGDVVTRDLITAMGGQGVAKARLSLVTLSGDDAAANGWVINGTKLTATATVAAHAGILDVIVTDELGQTYSFPSFQWAFGPPVGSDTMAPCVPLGVTLSSSTGGYSVFADQVSDNYDGNASPTGVKEYRVYDNSNNNKLSTVAAPALNKGSKLSNNTVGTPAGSNTATQNKRTWTLVANAGDFTNTAAENGIFEAVALTGNQAVCVTVGKYTSAYQYSQAGIMVRESASPGAVAVTLYLHPQNNGIRAAVKTSQGGTTVNFAQLLSIDGPINLALERGTGDVWTCLFSTDGKQWNVLGTVTQPMVATPLWGLFAASRNPGNPITAVFTDFNLVRKPTINTQIAAAVTQAIYLTAVDIAGNESGHSSVLTFSPPITAGKIVHIPGIRVRIGGYASMPSLSLLKAGCDALWGPSGLDINNQIKGISVSATLAQLESPTINVYDGFGAENGDTKITALISMLKSYPVPKDLTILINSAGNGYQPQTSTSFLSSFAPAYMNASLYDFGEAHMLNDGTPETPRLKYWNINVANRLIAYVKHVYDKFGTDTPTGGVYRIDALQEISNIEGMGGYTYSNLLNVWAALCGGLRSAAPKMSLFLKPTFINPNNGSSYVTIVREMINNFISMGHEDTSNASLDWGGKAYLGLWPGYATIDYTKSNNGNPGWDFHCNVDPSELFYDRGGSNGVNTPGALSGTGRIYDMSPTYPGIWTRVNIMKGSHVDIYADAYGGYNVNGRTYRSSAPPNPTPGPGAGLVAAHPNLIDVLTGNTKYAGVVANGCAIPWTQYPFGYPLS
jgi:hypothetical protein